jgi:hypothetical protein
VVPQLVAAQAVGSVRDLAKARPGAAAEPAGAWAANLWRRRSLRAVRRNVHRARRTPDRIVRRRQVPGVGRPRVAARRALPAGAGVGVPRPVAAWAHGLRRRWTDEGALVMLALAGVLALGSRHLITRGVPEVGDLLPLGTGGGAVRLVLTVGLVPLGIVGALVAGRVATGSARAPAATAVAYAALPMPYAALAGGRWAPLALYAAAPWWLALLLPAPASPPPPPALPAGTAPGLPAGAEPAPVADPVAEPGLPVGGAPGPAVGGAPGLPVGGAPGPAVGGASRGWVSRSLGLVGPAAWGRRIGAAARRRARASTAAAHRVVVLGIVTAVVAAVVPTAPVLLAGTGLALALGGLLAFRWREVLPPVVIGLGGALVAVALHLPWAVDPASAASPWSALQRLAGDAGDLAAVDPVELLGFGVGRPEALPWLWALPAAAAIPLLVGRGDRLTGAIRVWTLALVAWSAALVVGRVGAEAPLPEVDALLVLAGVAVAASVGLGAAAVESDLAPSRRRRVRRRDRRRWRPPTQARRIGWRSLTAVVAVGTVALATLPLLRSALDGYWGMPRGDFGSVLAFVGDDVAASGGRILWLGDTRVVPLRQDAAAGRPDLGRSMGTGLASTPDGVGASAGAGTALAVTDRLPRVADRWHPAPAAVVRRARESVEAGAADATHRLGGALAPLGVEYVVVPQGLAPAPFGPPEAPSPRVVHALDSQLDLERVAVDPAVVVYRNLAFTPGPEGAVGDGDRPGPAEPPQTFPDPSSRRPPAPGQGIDPTGRGEPSPWKLRLGLTAWGGVLLFLLVHQRRRAAIDGPDEP